MIAHLEAKYGISTVFSWTVEAGENIEQPYFIHLRINQAKWITSNNVQNWLIKNIKSFDNKFPLTMKNLQKLKDVSKFKINRPYRINS